MENQTIIAALAAVTAHQASSPEFDAGFRAGFLAEMAGSASAPGGSDPWARGYLAGAAHAAAELPTTVDDDDDWTAGNVAGWQDAHCGRPSVLLPQTVMGEWEYGYRAGYAAATPDPS